jgi:hypothetical protein
VDAKVKSQDLTHGFEASQRRAGTSHRGSLGEDRSVLRACCRWIMRPSYLSSSKPLVMQNAKKRFSMPKNDYYISAVSSTTNCLAPPLSPNAPSDRARTHAVNRSIGNIFSMAVGLFSLSYSGYFGNPALRMGLGYGGVGATAWNQDQVGIQVCWKLWIQLCPARLLRSRPRPL